MSFPRKRESRLGGRCALSLLDSRFRGNDTGACVVGFVSMRRALSGDADLVLMHGEADIGGGEQRRGDAGILAATEQIADDRLGLDRLAALQVSEHRRRQRRSL